MIETNIGARVKTLRETSRMTQVELAKVLGLNDRQSVSDIENGRRRLRADELVRVVEQFDVSLEWITNPFLLSTRDSFSWRQHHVPLADLEAYEGRAGEWIGAYRELNRLSDVRLKKLLPRLGLTYASSFEDACEAGESVALELGLGKRPALSLAKLLQKQLGILVLMVDTIEGVSGAACRLSAMNAILINRHERASRRNSDLAHELFHILTWTEMKPERVESATVDWDQPLQRSERRNQRIEQLADSFGAGLLMPSSELDRIGSPHGDILVWLTAAAFELGVSGRALKWRMVNSGRLPQAKEVPNEDLDAAADATVGSQAETDVPLPFSRPFVETIVRGIEAGHLSGGRAAQLLDMSKGDLGMLCDAYELKRPIELS
jgi:Zn-dependent peptidase ImmA (M78 family)/DNA-binding XRE family transcriptional regulator